MSKRSPKQHARQDREHREKGRYAKTNPCFRCGKSAGVEYWSVNADTTDVLGNEWADIALCVCQKCASYLENLEPAMAWADVKSKEYGKHPQGKAPTAKPKITAKEKLLALIQAGDESINEVYTSELAEILGCTPATAYRAAHALRGTLTPDKSEFNSFAEGSFDGNRRRPGEYHCRWGYF